MKIVSLIKARTIKYQSSDQIQVTLQSFNICLKSMDVLNH